MQEMYVFYLRLMIINASKFHKRAQNFINLCKSCS